MSDENTQNVNMQEPQSNEAPASEPITEPEAPTPPVHATYELERTVELPVSKEVIVLKRLKAGKHYTASQHFISWMKAAFEFVESSKIDPSKILDKDGNPDLVKLESQHGNKSKKTMENLELLSENVDKIQLSRACMIGACMDKTGEQVLEEYYPEDLEVLFKECTELNQFNRAIKK
jgi:hypothetical protein